MKEIYGLEITDRAVAKIEATFERGITEIEKDEVIEYLHSKTAGYDGIECDTESKVYWLEEEKEAVLGTSNKGDLYWIEDLGLYTSFNESEGNQLDTIGTVIDYYFGREYINMEEDTEGKFLKEYKEALNNIEWYKEDLELKKEIDEALKDFEIEEGKDVIELCSRSMYADIIKALEEEYSINEYEVMEEMYHYEKIYRIKNKLYYVTDDSWNFNFEYHWYFQEVGNSVYKYFKFYEEGEECDSAN
ncbi:MAG: hypothetical protein PWP67_528 [Clostridium butyricum]|nr:hypothetical protein [Clostridium butyricum]